MSEGRRPPPGTEWLMQTQGGQGQWTGAGHYSLAYNFPPDIFNEKVYEYLDNKTDLCLSNKFVGMCSTAYCNNYFFSNI